MLHLQERFSKMPKTYRFFLIKSIKWRTKRYTRTHFTIGSHQQIIFSLKHNRLTPWDFFGFISLINLCN